MSSSQDTLKNAIAKVVSNVVKETKESEIKGTKIATITRQVIVKIIKPFSD